MESMVKVGDIISDVEEGLNAGLWTVGVSKTGNEIGLTLHFSPRHAINRIQNLAA